MSNRVRAQFWVKSVLLNAVSGGNVSRVVTMAPVVRATGQPGYDPEGNTDWSKYTPSGHIEMTVSAEAAGAIFQDAVGKDVRITFEVIEPGES